MSEQIIEPEVLNSPVATVPYDRSPDALASFGEGGLGRALMIANKLREVVVEKGWAVRIGQGEHLRVEAWMTLGGLCGLVASIKEIRADEEGFWATADVIRLSTGQSLGGAQSTCDWAERNWKDRDRHALVSMAQTRAISKALSMKTRWIAELAGFNGTPAEEMPRDDTGRGGTTTQQVAEQRVASHGGAGTPPRPAITRPPVIADFLDLPVGFGKKFSDKTWRHMSEGEYGGERWSYLSWIADKFEPKSRMQNEIVLRAKTLLAGYESANRNSNPAADAAPDSPGWDADVPLPEQPPVPESPYDK